MRVMDLSAQLSQRRHCERSEAIQSLSEVTVWIASSLLAMSGGAWGDLSRRRRPRPPHPGPRFVTTREPPLSWAGAIRLYGNSEFVKSEAFLPIRLDRTDSPLSFGKFSSPKSDPPALRRIFARTGSLDHLPGSRASPELFAQGTRNQSTPYIFVQSSRNGISRFGVICWLGEFGQGRGIVLGKTYFIKQASTLLKFAKSTSNAELSAKLVSKAADLKSRADPLRDRDIRLKAPDVDSDDQAGAP